MSLIPVWAHISWNELQLKIWKVLVMSLCVHAVVCFHSTTCIAFENLHKYGEKDGGGQGNEIHEWCRMTGNKPIDSNNWWHRTWHKGASYCFMVWFLFMFLTNFSKNKVWSMSTRHFVTTFWELVFKYIYAVIMCYMCHDISRKNVVTRSVILCPNFVLHSIDTLFVAKIERSRKLFMSSLKTIP